MRSWKTSAAIVSAVAAAGALIVVPPLLGSAGAMQRAEELRSTVAQLRASEQSAPADDTTPTATPTATPSATPSPTPTRTKRAAANEPPPRTEGDKKIVYLTFDDGPDPAWTPQVLALLAADHATATFFMIGKEAAHFPHQVAAVRGAGHTVANHTWDHPWLTSLSPAAVASQITRTEAVLGTTACMRPPGGFVNASVSAVARRLGQHVQLWDDDTRDWARPGTPAIVAAVKKQLRPGAVVLLHDGGGDRSQTVAALRTLLPYFAAQGYVVRPLPACA